MLFFPHLKSLKKYPSLIPIFTIIFLQKTKANLIYIFSVFKYFLLKRKLIYQQNDIIKKFSRCSLLLNLQEKMQVQMYKEIYSPLITQVLKKYLKNNKIFYDIGAHVGYFSCMAFEIMQNENSQIYAFEPNPLRSKALNFLVKTSKSKIKYFNVALGNENKKVSFALNTANSGMAHVTEYNKGIDIDTDTDIDTDGCNNNDHNNNNNNIKIKMFTLDYFIENHFLIPPQIMKVDIEGAEFNFLKGAQKTLTKYKPIIIMEINLKSAIENNILSLLEDMRYSCFSVKSLGKEELNINLLKEYSNNLKNLDIFLVPTTFCD